MGNNMGYMAHNAIVVTSWKEEHIRDARISAIILFPDMVSEIIISHINGYLSFFIATDGSKEGWEDSNIGDENRARFLKEIEDMYIDAVDVRYGGDDPDQATVEGWR